MRSIIRTIAGLVALLAASPGALGAHGALKSSSPKNGAHLEVAPRELRLVFNEPTERRFTRLELVGPGGAAVALGELVIPSDSATVVRAAITGALVGGVYQVRWQTAGRDGHPVRGDFQFVIAPGAAGLAAPAPDAPPPTAADTPSHAAGTAAHHPPTALPTGGVFDAESPLYAAVRWLGFLGIVGVIGAAAFRYAVIELMNRRAGPAGVALIEPALEHAAGIGLALSALLLVAAALRLAAQSVAMHGAADALRPSYVASMVLQTLWGRAWLLQVLGTLVAAAGFRAARGGSLVGWRAVAGGALLLAISPALSGHAAAVPRLAPAAVGADALHVIGASGWLGSLFFVVAAGVAAAMRLAPGEGGPAVAELVNAFSPTALAFAALAGVTGVFAGWLHLGELAALWETRYGRTLLLKLGVLSVVAATGAYNWLRVRPALGDEVGARRVSRSATVEVAVAVVVLAITAVLVATPAGMD